MCFAIRSVTQSKHINNNSLSIPNKLFHIIHIIFHIREGTFVI